MSDFKPGEIIPSIQTAADGLRTSAGISADKPCPNGVIHSVIKKEVLKRTGACLKLGGKRSNI